jgi:hypothetical protein
MRATEREIEEIPDKKDECRRRVEKTMFYIGQKVECINDKPARVGESLNVLRKNRIYTVRWHGFIAVGYFPAQYKIRLWEIFRKKRPLDPLEDMPYLAQRFRPLIESKTDISALEALLDSDKDTVERFNAREDERV